MRLPLQDDCVVVAGRVEARRKLQAALEDALRVAVAPQPAGDLREHPQCRHIGGPRGQVRAQGRFGLRQVVGHQARRGVRQRRIVVRGAQEVGAGGIAAGLIAQQVQAIGELAPGLRPGRLEGRRLAQRGSGARPVAGVGQGDAELEVDDGRARLFVGQGRERLHGRPLADQPLRTGQDQPGARMGRQQLEDFAGLGGGSHRAARQQTLCVGEGRLRPTRAGPERCRLVS